MDALQEYMAAWPQLLPFLFVLLFTGIIAPLINRFLLLKQHGSRERNLTRQFIVLTVIVIGFVTAIMVTPMSGESRRAVLSLISIGLTAVVAMSSTTIVSNFMAGLMLRLVRSYHPGDFIRVNNLFGRVTALGILHTEIQTETRDLATIPNSLLVSTPFTVVRSSGTIVSTDLSLGYDISHSIVEELLVDAAEKAGLEKPFVLVTELGNYAVGYRVSGFLADVKGLVTARSTLRIAALDTLNAAGIEIVSPTFMNQRQLEKGDRFLSRPPKKVDSQQFTAEEIAFDKANEVEELENLQKEKSRLKTVLDELPHEREDASPNAATGGKKAQIREELDRIVARIENLQEKTEGDED